AVGVLSLVSVLVTIRARIAIIPAAETSPWIGIKRLAVVHVLARHRGAVLVPGVVTHAAVIAVVPAMVAIAVIAVVAIAVVTITIARSEEHTSELQSLTNL